MEGSRVGLWGPGARGLRAAHSSPALSVSAPGVPAPALWFELPGSACSLTDGAPEGTLDGESAPPRDLYLPSLLSSRPPGAQRSRTSEGSFCSSRPQHQGRGRAALDRLTARLALMPTHGCRQTVAGIWGLLVTPGTGAGGRQSIPLLRALCAVEGRSEGG